METTTQTQVKTRTKTAILGAAIIIAAAAGLIIKNQETGLNVSGGNYNFGKVMVKETVEKVFIVENPENGDYKLTVSELTGVFTINKDNSTCQTILQAGKTCKLAIKFTPFEAIKYKAVVAIRYVLSGKVKSALLKLQGEGVPSEMDTACVDNDVTDKNFAGMPLSTYKFVNVFKSGHIKGLHPVTGAFMEADDKCWNEKKLLEYFCDGKSGKATWGSYDCPGVCENGACKEVECSTSIINAKGVSVNGACSWECVAPWENKDGKETNGCECNSETKEGCPVSQCSDSDGGIVFDKIGTTQGLSPITGQIIEKTDKCPGLFQITEFYCDGDYVALNDQIPNGPPLSGSGTPPKCSEGKYCNDGVCQPCQKKNLGYTLCNNLGGKYYESEMILQNDCSIHKESDVEKMKFCGTTADSCADGKCVKQAAKLSLSVWGNFPGSQILMPGQNQGIAAFSYIGYNADIKIKQFKFYLNATAAAKTSLADWQLKINDSLVVNGKIMGDNVIFENINYIYALQNTGSNKLKIFATVKNPLSMNDAVQLEIKAADQVVAENAENGEPAEILGAFPLKAATMVGDQPEAISSAGLKVEYAGDSPVPAQLVAGTINNEIVRYKMTAIGEDVSITSMDLYYTGKVEYVSAIKFFLDGKQVGEPSGYVLTAAKQPVNFTDGSVILKNGVPAKFSIKLDFHGKDVVNTSTTPLKIAIADGDGDYSDWDGKPEGYFSIGAVGLSSGKTIDKTKIDSAGDGSGGAAGSNPFTLHRGILQVSLNSGSTGGSVTSGSGQDLLRLNLQALGDDIQINDIEFVANGTCKPNGASGTYLRSADLSSTYAEWSTADSLNGEMPQSWSFSVNEKDKSWNEPLIISAGETKILRLIGDTTGCQTNEVLSVSIAAPSANNATKAGIEYQDSSNVNIDLKTTKELPVNGKALVY